MKKIDYSWVMDGNTVHKDLEEMTEGKRAHCVIPGYWDEDELSLLLVYAKADTKAIGGPKVTLDDVTVMLKKAMAKHYDLWQAYATAVSKDVEKSIKAKLRRENKHD